jgi:uncharacterized protein YjbI with pentapeptide repeats
MYGADFRFAHLDGANLQAARADRSFFWKAHLKGANLMGASLDFATFDDADLRNAQFKDASFHQTSLAGADLSGATGLTQRQVDEARGNMLTKLPEGIIRPISWSAKTFESQSP